MTQKKERRRKVRKNHQTHRKWQRIAQL